MPLPNYPKTKPGRNNPKGKRKRNYAVELLQTLHARLPGYNYVGFQSSRYNGEAVNELDYYAYMHDRMYEWLADNGVDPYYTWNTADQWFTAMARNTDAPQRDIDTVLMFMKLKESTAARNDQTFVPYDTLDEFEMDYNHEFGLDMLVEGEQMPNLDANDHLPANGIGDMEVEHDLGSNTPAFGYVNNPITSATATYVLTTKFDNSHFGRYYRQAMPTRHFGKRYQYGKQRWAL